MRIDSPQSPEPSPLSGFISGPETAFTSGDGARRLPDRPNLRPLAWPNGCGWRIPACSRPRVPRLREKPALEVRQKTPTQRVKPPRCLAHPGADSVLSATEKSLGSNFVGGERQPWQLQLIFPRPPIRLFRIRCAIPCSANGGWAPPSRLWAISSTWWRCPG